MGRKIFRPYSGFARGFEILADGDGFAAGGADVAGEDGDEAFGDAEVFQRGDGVCDSMWQVELKRVEQAGVVGAEVHEKNVIGQAVIE